MAILAAVLVPTVTSKIQSANDSSANSTASAFANSIRTDIISIQSGVTTSLDVLKVDNNGTFTGENLGTVKCTVKETTIEDGKSKTTFTVAAGKITIKTEVSSRYVIYTVNNKGEISQPYYNTNPPAEGGEGGN